MARTLSEIVSSSLQAAELSTKVASVRDATPDSSDDYLARALGQYEIKVAEETLAPAAKTKVASANELLDDCTTAIKIATALERCADLVEKIAESPAVLPEPFAHSGTTSPKAQGPGTQKATVGPQGSLPTTSGPEKVAANRGAAERLLSSKIAEFEVLRSLGQTDAATEVFETARKLAEELGVTSGGEGTHVPDNAGMAALTKAQARDATTREATAAFGISPKVDNAVAAHTLRTDGLKVSSLTALVAAKIAAKKDEKGVANSTYAAALPSLAGTIGAAVTGDSHNRGRRVLGQLAGNTVGAIGGVGLGALTKNHNAMMALGHLGGIAGGGYGHHLVEKATRHEKGGK